MPAIGFASFRPIGEATAESTRAATGCFCGNHQAVLPDHPTMKTVAAASLARVQGWFYVITGAWPLVHGSSFQAISGFKADFWLAQTVGLLLVVSGGVLLRAVRAGRLTPELMLLAAGEAAALAAMDIHCVFQPRTTPAYWADAVIELSLVLAWARTWRARP
jgi:signal transduction histidine kinase